MQWRAIVKSKLTFFDNKMRVFLINAIVLSKYSFSFIPEAFNAVGMITILCHNCFGVIDTEMFKIAHIKGAITSITIRVKLSALIVVAIIGISISFVVSLTASV